MLRPVDVNSWKRIDTPNKLKERLQFSCRKLMRPTSWSATVIMGNIGADDANNASVGDPLPEGLERDEKEKWETAGRKLQGKIWDRKGCWQRIQSDSRRGFSILWRLAQFVIKLAPVVSKLITFCPSVAGQRSVGNCSLDRKEWRPNALKTRYERPDKAIYKFDPFVPFWRVGLILHCCCTHMFLDKDDSRLQESLLDVASLVALNALGC